MADAKEQAGLMRSGATRDLSTTGSADRRRCCFLITLETGPPSSNVYEAVWLIITCHERVIV